MKKILSFVCLLMLAMTSAWAGEVATFDLSKSPGASTPAGFFTHEAASAAGKWNWNSKFNGAEYDGMSFSQGLKMEGATAINFTTTEVSTVTIVQSTWSANTIKLDGTELAIADAADGTGCRIYTVADVSAGDHVIARGSGESGLFYIKVEWEATKSVTFINDANWETVYVYAWDKDNKPVTDEWPGTTLTEKDVEGNYIWTTKADPVGILFNNGFAQTTDLDFKDGGVYNSTGRVIALNDYSATFKTDGMDEVWAYVWNGDVKALGDWPGTKMEGGSGEFSIAIKAEEAPKYIIFHNNAGEQTPDWEFEDGKAYEYMLNEYTATFTYFSSTIWENVYAYAWSGEGDNVKEFVGAWPGTQLTLNGGVYAFSCKAFNAPEKIIFNSGSNENQTADLPFIDGKNYKWNTTTPFYALKEGETFAAGTTVDLTAATITYGVDGGADFGAAYAAVNEDYAGFAFMTGGNGENGSIDGGTVYTIVPQYEGTITIGVRLNGNKAMHINEDGTDMEGYSGYKIANASNTTFSFDVKAGSTYKIWCDGSKLGFFGFDYSYDAPVARTATFDFTDPNFRDYIGTSTSDTNGYIYNETFTADGTTLQVTSGSSPSRLYVDNNRGQNLATYPQYATLTFRAPVGKAITKIEFTAAGNSNINKFEASSGAIEGMVWTGNADGVRFMQGGTSYLANAIVTLADKDGATAALPAIAYTECANIAAFNALEAGTYAKLTLTNAEVTGKSADGYSTVWVQDATGGAWIQYTSLNANLQEMTKLNGTVFTIKRATSGNPQLKEAEDTPKSEIASEAISQLTIIEGKTIAEVNIPENLNRVVKLAGAKFEATSATQGTLTIGEETITVNNGTATANQQMHKLEFAKGDIMENVTIVAILVAASATDASKNQLYPISMEEAGPIVVSDLSIVTSVEYENTEASYTEKIASLTDQQVASIKAELGLESLSEAVIYVYNPTTKEMVVDENYGWRDANGDSHEWTGNAEVPACVHYTDGQNYPCYNIQGCDPQTVKTYWAITYHKKAVLVEVDVIYTKPAAIELTLTGVEVEVGVNYDVNEDDYTFKSIILTSEQANSILNAIELQAFDDPNCIAYIYDPITNQFAKDNYYGWRGYDGLGHNWSSNGDSPICVIFQNSENIGCYNLYGIEPQTITTYFAIANTATKKAALIKVNFTYEGTFPHYTVAGAFGTGVAAGTDDPIFGKAWDITEEAGNDLTKTDRTTFTLTIEDVELTAGTIYYKVVQDHSWDINWGFGSNDADYQVNMPNGLEKAVFDITFTFSPMGLNNGYKVSCDVVYDEITTGISNMAAEKQASDAIYNLQGVRLNKLQKGLNIIGGKKIFVK